MKGVGETERDCSLDIAVAEDGHTPKAGFADSRLDEKRPSDSNARLSLGREEPRLKPLTEGTPQVEF